VIDVPETARLFGRHVERGAEDRAGLRARRHPRVAGPVLHLGDAEIEDLRDLLVVVRVANEEDVLRLEIAMDDPALVRAREPAADLLEDLRRVLKAHATEALDALVERLAGEQLHDDVRLAVFRHAVVVDLDRVLRLDGRSGLRFLVEAAPCFLAVGVLRLDELDRAWRAEGHVTRLPDGAHAASADHAHQRVLAGDEALRRRRFGVGCHGASGGEEGRMALPGKKTPWFRLGRRQRGNGSKHAGPLRKT
jgi:hypothetical protein